MTETAHKTLWEALLAFQADAPTLQKDKINPAFRSRYLSLDALMGQVLPVLNKHGLIWITKPEANSEGRPVLTYRLVCPADPDRTGIEGTMPLLLSKEDPQGLGSAITYARRYALMAVLGLVADEDDDGAKASRPTGRISAPAPNGGAVSSGPAQATVRAATAKQRGLINAKAAEKNLPPEDLANIVLAATESPVREFDSQSDAEAWLRRAMDRLPATAVDGVLAGIDQADPVDLSL